MEHLPSPESMERISSALSNQVAGAEACAGSVTYHASRLAVWTIILIALGALDFSVLHFGLTEYLTDENGRTHGDIAGMAMSGVACLFAGKAVSRMQPTTRLGYFIRFVGRSSIGLFALAIGAYLASTIYSNAPRTYFSAAGGMGLEDALPGVGGLYATLEPILGALYATGFLVVPTLALMLSSAALDQIKGALEAIFVDGRRARRSRQLLNELLAQQRDIIRRTTEVEARLAIGDSANIQRCCAELSAHAASALLPAQQALAALKLNGDRSSKARPRGASGLPAAIEALDEAELERAIKAVMKTIDLTAITAVARRHLNPNVKR